ncbi:MAG TPA: hypothetical protein VFB06_14460 [Streptosporangiaceae bacterium]|nr:hypothetical protein [Streptosporangiaceae bacterium]
MARKRTGPYLIQAAIADLHLHQPRDWPQIAALYQTLARQTGSPVAEMNRAIAVAEIDGPEAGLAILDRLDLDHYRYFHSTRADLLRRAGRDEEAHHAYRRALDLAQTEPEQRFLADRLAETAPSPRDAHRLPADRDCGQLPPDSDPVSELRAHGPYRPLGLAAGPGRGRAACAWSALCGSRYRSAPAVPSATWTFTPSWRIDPRERGSGYHKGENHHAVEAHRASRGPTGSQRSGQASE